MQATFHIKRERIAHFHMEHYKRLAGSLHFHSHVELLLMRQGTAEVWINDAKETVHEGQLAVVPGFVPHHFESNGNTVACTDLFIPSFLCPEFAEALGSKEILSHIVRDQQAMERIKKAVSELEREGLNPIEQSGHIRVILGTVLDQLTLGAAAPCPQSFCFILTSTIARISQRPRWRRPWAIVRTTFQNAFAPAFTWGFPTISTPCDCGTPWC